MGARVFVRCRGWARTREFREGWRKRAGIDWVNNGGPRPRMMKADTQNGHEQPVAPLKRVTIRNVPVLTPVLQHVVNALDLLGRHCTQCFALRGRRGPPRGAIRRSSSNVGSWTRMSKNYPVQPESARRGYWRRRGRTRKCCYNRTILSDSNPRMALRVSTISFADSSNPL